MSIKIGDKVDVFFENVKAEFNLKVKYIPVATGDSWHLVRMFKEEEITDVYINSFSKMIKTVNI